MLTSKKSERNNNTFEQKHGYKHLFVDVDKPCPVYQEPSSGKHTLKPYIYLDSGASTPSFRSALALVNKYIPYYSSIHRGNGFKSLLSTHLYEMAREAVMDFVGANSEDHVCIFTRNTTESINKLAKRFPFTPERHIVLTTGMEHHADDLPWRAFAPNTIFVNILSDGQLDMKDLDDKLACHGSSIALVAVCGASNVTGIINPYHLIAEKAHAVGAKVFVDCAQLIAHRSFDMKSIDDPQHIDFIAFSGHKMYAPYGTGCLVGLRDVFEKGEPDLRGGGAVTLVTQDTVLWAPTPDRDEAGSPNVPGSVALLAAIKTLRRIGMDTVAQHELELMDYAYERLLTVPGIRIFGDHSTHANKVGVLTFSIDGLPHNYVTAVLAYEHGIGVRSGCFCAHPLVTFLLGMQDYIVNEYKASIANGERPLKPGLIRCSFGLFNTEKDVDALVSALHLIVKQGVKDSYIVSDETGEYVPQRWSPSILDDTIDVDQIVSDSFNPQNQAARSTQPVQSFFSMLLSSLWRLTIIPKQSVFESVPWQKLIS